MRMLRPPHRTWSRRARVATCSTARSSVLLMCSPANMADTLPFRSAASASASSSWWGPGGRRRGFYDEGVEGQQPAPWCARRWPRGRCFVARSPPPHLERLLRRALPREVHIHAQLVTDQRVAARAVGHQVLQVAVAGAGWWFGGGKGGVCGRQDETSRLAGAARLCWSSQREGERSCGGSRATSVGRVVRSFHRARQGAVKGCGGAGEQQRRLQQQLTARRRRRASDQHAPLLTSSLYRPHAAAAPSRQATPRWRRSPSC